MSLKIDDVMTHHVITVQPHHTLEHVKGVMEKNRVSAVPIVNSDGEPVGIVTSTDFISKHKEGTPVSAVMNDHVWQVPQYNEVAVAAKIMKKRHIHHLVVTHEKQVVGIVSSFDLLGIIGDARWVRKDRGTKPKGSRHG